MANTYKKPFVLLNEELAEGVYAASGAGSKDLTSSDGCFKVTANIHQVPETGRGDYRIQVTANHIPSYANHQSNSQTLVITFNQPVTFKECGAASYVSGNGTTTLTLRRYNWCNGQSEGVGFGDVIVTSDGGLGLVSVKFTCDL